MWVILFLLLFAYLAYSLGPIAWLILIVGILMMFVVASSNAEAAKEREKKKNLNRIAIKSGKMEGFIPSKEIYRNFSDHAVYIDERYRKIMLAQLVDNTRSIFRFDELVECSIIQDGATILSGGAGNAVVGGIIAGTTGAVIGASSRETKPVSLSMSIRIITNNIQMPLYEIPIITASTDRTSDDYKQKTQFAQEIYATMISILNAPKTSSYARSGRGTWR